MATYTFFTNPLSRGQIARWALHEVGADYETELVEWAAKSEAFLTAIRTRMAEIAGRRFLAQKLKAHRAEKGAAG